MASEIKPEPIDLRTWLACVNVNDLSDEDAAALWYVDLEDDAQLEDLAVNWIRPWFLRHNDQNRQGLRQVLAASDQWSLAELRPVFETVGLLGGQKIEDIPRFLAALKKAVQE